LSRREKITATELRTLSTLLVHFVPGIENDVHENQSHGRRAGAGKQVAKLPVWSM
jgi:hypothetical protein